MWLFPAVGDYSQISSERSLIVEKPNFNAGKSLEGVLG
jgi:hypothetical protein